MSGFSSNTLATEKPRIQYQLVIAVVGGGTTDPEPGVYLYSEGSVAIVDAVDVVGWSFSYWSLDGVDVGSENPYSVLMDANHTLIAFFVEAQTYELLISSFSGGTTNPSPGSHQFYENQVVPVSANPFSNWSFDHWTLDGVDVGSVNPYSVLMDTNHNITAYFIEDPEFSLVIDSIGGGNTDPAPGTYWYYAGTNVSVQASGGPGIGLDYWLLDGINVGAENPYNLIMNSNYNLTAVFDVVPQYELLIAVIGNGSTNPSPGKHMYNEGSVASVEAVGDPNGIFEYWLLDGVNVGSTNPYVVTMDSNHTLIAAFRDVETAIFVAPASISKPVGETFTVEVRVQDVIDLYGLCVSFIWDPAILDYTSHIVTAPVEDYPEGVLHNPIIIIVNYVNATAGTFEICESTLGGPAFTGEGIIFKMTFEVSGVGFSPLGIIETDIANINAQPILHTVTNGTFDNQIPQVQHKLTIDVLGNGTTSPLPGSYYYSEGTLAWVDAIPDPGYKLDYWMLNGSNVGFVNPLGITMEANYTLVAVFARIEYTLYISVSEDGTSDPTPGNYTFYEGTSVSVTALPYTGYSFDYWLLDSNITYQNPLEVTMDYNHTLIAFFTPLPPEISDIEWNGIAPFPYGQANITRINEPVSITVNVTSSIEITKVILSYRVDAGEWWNTTMTYNSTNNLWSTLIPGNLANATVEFLVSAYDIIEQISTSGSYSYFIHPLLIGDIDGDGDVDIFDVVMVVSNYGKTTP